MGTSYGITEPVARPMLQLLRRAVLDLARDEHRRDFPPTLHVGLPGRVDRQFTADPADQLDHALRTDVVETMLRPAIDRAVVPLIWLTRRDNPDGDEAFCDAEWSAAVRAAGGELGLGLGLVVVTRRSWRDPVTGVGRVWQRMRMR